MHLIGTHTDVATQYRLGTYIPFHSNSTPLVCAFSTAHLCTSLITITNTILFIGNVLIGGIVTGSTVLNPYPISLSHSM